LADFSNNLLPIVKLYLNLVNKEEEDCNNYSSLVKKFSHPIIHKAVA